MPRKAKTKIGCLLVCTLLCGCNVGPNFKKPSAPNTNTYTEAPQPEQTVSSKGKGGETQYINSGQRIPEQWWGLFHSDPLNQLIVKGITNSPNIDAAKAALRQAHENYRVSAGNYLFPAFDLQAGAQRQQITGANFGNENSPTSIFNLFNTQVNVSYTLDIFGGNRRALEALCAQVDYQRYELEAAYLALTANIVTSAITEAALRAQIAATYSIIKLEEDLLSISRKQYNLGGIAQTDVLTQESQLAQSRTELPPLEKKLSQTRNNLAALIGEIPSQATIPTFSLDELQLPTDLPLSLPSSLVQQRPDIRASEALLHQASAQIGVATANLLPNVTLSGYDGWQANQIGDLFKNSTNVWNIATNLMQPIFHGGALLAQRRASIAAFDQARAQYRQTVIVAFQNVADALRAIEMDAKELAAQTEALDAATKLLKLTEDQYRLGSVTYLVLLTAQRQYNQALIGRIQAQATRYTDTAALFQALGGSWWQSALIGENPNG